MEAVEVAQTAEAKRKNRPRMDYADLIALPVGETIVMPRRPQYRFVGKPEGAVYVTGRMESGEYSVRRVA